MRTGLYASTPSKWKHSLEQTSARQQRLEQQRLEQQQREASRHPPWRPLAPATPTVDGAEIRPRYLQPSRRQQQATRQAVSDFSRSTTLTITCPEGLGAGDALDVAVGKPHDHCWHLGCILPRVPATIARTGQEEMEVTIPEGVSAGMEFDLEIESLEDEQQAPKAAQRPVEERQRHWRQLADGRSGSQQPKPSSRRADRAEAMATARAEPAPGEERSFPTQSRR